MARFMLLLYDNPTDWSKVSPEEMQKAIEKYMAWTKKPFTVDSLRLANDHGRVLNAKSGTMRVTDGPFAEAKEVLGGYYTIEAADYEEAVKLAREHPHLEYGGTIVIRQTWES